jgi:hypothetical protein
MVFFKGSGTMEPESIGATMAEIKRIGGPEEEEVRRELLQLRQEHRDLDAAIQALVESGSAADTIRIQRLKKRKLALKDRIAVLEDRLLPDIIA